MNFLASKSFKDQKMIFKKLTTAKQHVVLLFRFSAVVTYDDQISF